MLLSIEVYAIILKLACIASFSFSQYLSNQFLYYQILFIQPIDRKVTELIIINDSLRVTLGIWYQFHRLGLMSRSLSVNFKGS